jgi:hypothetical protein
MTSYSKNFPLVAVFIFIGLFTSSIPTRAETTIQSITLEAGPVATKHIQAGNEDYRERHGLGILKVHTNDYGNWALYLLAPNSVDNTSVGVGYVTDPYTLPVGPLKLELSGALGLVTGYQDYPVPLLAAEARLVLFENGSWDAGLAMAANPYYMQEEGPSGDNHFGVVVTSPFLSIRYNFN